MVDWLDGWRMDRQTDAQHLLLTETMKQSPFLEKLTVAELVKECAAFYGT
jgi:hypothetical protein